MIFMLRAIRFCVASTSTAFLLSGPVIHSLVWARSRPLSQSDFTKTAERLVEYTDPDKTAKAYGRFFPRLTSDQLGSLRTHRHDGIALRAAWELVARTVAIRERDGQFPVYRPDPQDLAAFHSFVEMRLGVATPDWWKQVLLDARSMNRGPMRFQRRHDELYRDTGLQQPGTNTNWQAPKGTSLVQQNQRVDVRIDGKVVKLPRGLLEQRQRNSDCLSIVIENERCFLVLHEHFRDSPALLGIDTTTQNILWETKVWGMDGLLAIQGGGFFHWVCLVVKGDQLFVFGADNWSVYIEGFSSKDGKNLFRFCSYY